MIAIGFLELRNNVFSGRIPTEMGLLYQLRDQLDLSRNRLSGPIPSELGMLVELRMFLLIWSFLILSPPSLILFLCSFSFDAGGLKLQYNLLTGQVPSEISQLVKVSCKIFPKQNPLTRQCTDAQSLSSFPAFYCKSPLIQVTSVQLEGNELSGTIPTEVCATFNITYPSFQSDCGDFNDQCPCCTSCCVDGGEICMCRYLNTPREFLCFQQKNLPP
jgi:hypothetical protein